MYIPAWFREERTGVLHDLIRAYSFATLVTEQAGAPFATHLPFLLDAGQGEFGTLRAHVARGNPQWQNFASDREALVIFQGPHAYISPSWYETQPNVPTWNYAVVHAYGSPRLMDEEMLRETLRASVETYEAGSAPPWSMDTLSEEYIGKMLRGIVGIEIPIARLEGKFKLSQNRSETDRERVIANLQQTADPLSHTTADWMAREGRRP